MNEWIKLSIEYANKKSYLDDLFDVYPIISGSTRSIDETIRNEIKKHFAAKNDNELIRSLLKLELFPIKDSYIAYLRNDKTAIDRNPQTIKRLCKELYEMGLDKIFERCSAPKETNRQIGPMFRNWIKKGSLKIKPVKLEKFIENDEDAILDASDRGMKDFARQKLGYNHDKGLDFVGRFNKKYVIGEAKFLTDFGGHQKAQFNDAIRTIKAEGVKAIKIAILDGVLFIKNHNEMHKLIIEEYKNENILSVLLLHKFLNQL
ncbi:hypothetical protein COTS27_00956 [Spirochaetota bacterium]|nr:hypothetical protein COTS27_00956 [Spirochaetota bacterium]